MSSCKEQAQWGGRLHTQHQSNKHPARQRRAGGACDPSPVTQPVSQVNGFFRLPGNPRTSPTRAGHRRPWAPELSLPLRPLQTSDQSPPSTRLAEVDAHVAARWSLLKEEELVSGVGDSGGQVRPQAARAEKKWDQDGLWDNPESGRVPEVPPSSSSPASRQRPHPPARSGSSGWHEVHLSPGHFAPANWPLSPGAGGRDRPDQGRGRRRSPAQPTGRDRQVPGGSLCPPGKERRRRGTRSDPHAPACPDLTLEPQGRPVHFLRRADRGGLLRALTSSKPGTTPSTCWARASATLPAPPPQEPPARPRPPPSARTRHHHRLPGLLHGVPAAPPIRWSTDWRFLRRRLPATPGHRPQPCRRVLATPPAVPRPLPAPHPTLARPLG